MSVVTSVPASSLSLGSAAYFIGSTLGNSVGNMFSGPIADALSFETLGRWMIAATTVELATNLVERLPSLLPALSIFIAALAVLFLWRSRMNVVLAIAGAALLGWMLFG